MTFKKRHIIPSVLLAFAPVGGAGAVPSAVSVTSFPDYQTARKAVLSAAPGSAEQLTALDHFLSVTAALSPDDREGVRVNMFAHLLNGSEPPYRYKVLEKFLNSTEGSADEYAENMVSAVFEQAVGSSELRDKAAEKILALADRHPSPDHRTYYLYDVATCEDCRQGLRYRAMDNWRATIAPLPPQEKFNAIVWSFDHHSHQPPHMIEKLGAGEMLELAEKLSDESERRTAYFYAARNGREDVSAKAQLLLFAMTETMSLVEKNNAYTDYANTSPIGTALERLAFEKWEQSLGQLTREKKLETLRWITTMPDVWIKPRLRTRAAELLAEEQKRNPAPSPVP